MTRVVTRPNIYQKVYGNHERRIRGLEFRTPPAVGYNWVDTNTFYDLLSDATPHPTDAILRCRTMIIPGLVVTAETVFQWVNIQLGSALAGSSHVYELEPTQPGIVLTATPHIVGHGWIRQAATNTLYTCAAEANSHNIVLRVDSVDTRSSPLEPNAWGPTFPFAAATGDQARLFLCYEYDPVPL